MLMVMHSAKKHSNKPCLLFLKRNEMKFSNGSGMEKVGFGQVQVYPNFQMSGSGRSGIRKVGFGRVLKFRVSSVFE